MVTVSIKFTKGVSLLLISLVFILASIIVIVLYWGLGKLFGLNVSWLMFWPFIILIASIVIAIVIIVIGKMS